VAPFILDHHVHVWTIVNQHKRRKCKQEGVRLRTLLGWATVIVYSLLL